MPKVSVIIPTFNRPKFLQAAIESVLKQTFQDFEVIVVNDASDEDVECIVQGFCDNRIKCIRHEINKGEAGARNTGIRHSNGEFIAFLDDDDIWFPDKLKLQMNVLENSPVNVGGVYSGFIAIDCAKQTSHIRVPTKRGDIYQDLLLYNAVGTPSTVLIRRACVETAGFFDEKIYYGVDYDFYLRIAKHFLFEYIEEPLVQYNIHENCLSNNLDIVIKGLDACFLKHKENLGNLKPIRQKTDGLWYLSLGVHYCYKGEMKKGTRALIKSIRLYPFEPRTYFNLGISLLGKNNFIKIRNLKDTLLVPFRSGRTIGH
jgi:glycosyltransferase involved in cell wall biosynthesis